VRWQPAKPPTRIKIVECGPGQWDEQDHRLDLPYPIHTVDFRVTGTGHDRIERTYQEGCANCRKIIGFNERQLSIASRTGYAATPARSYCSTRRHGRRWSV
jgi:hypothetical protein